MPQTPPIVIRAAQAPHTWIGLRMPIRFADATNGASGILPGTLLVVPHSLIGSALFPPIRWLAWALLALGVTLICWLPLLRGLTRSLVRMEQATGRIAEGRFDTKLAIDRHDEVGRLAASIEQMAGRLDVLVSGQKRFLGDSAHELRSPLGRMRVALEILEQRVGDEDRSYVADLQEDVEELASLTDNLLEFARFDLGARTAPAVETDVAEAVRRAVRRESHAGVDVEIAVPEGLKVMAQPDALFRAVANVLRNAVRYAGASGPILVHAHANDSAGTVDVVVSDRGPGVPPDALDRLCEPFFRVDAARNRKTGGTGLGLAITKSAVEASGGRITCRNRVPTGLEVRLTLSRP
jgi:signal transduction histidine kinase